MKNLSSVTMALVGIGMMWFNDHTLGMLYIVLGYQMYMHNDMIEMRKDLCTR